MRVGGKYFIQHKKLALNENDDGEDDDSNDGTSYHSQPRSMWANKLWFIYQITIFVLWLTPLF